MDCPKTVNGYTVIAFRRIPKQAMQREGWVICVSRFANEFVVACLFRDGERVDREWCNGDYEYSLVTAGYSFDERCRQYKAV